MARRTAVAPQSDAVLGRVKGSASLRPLRGAFGALDPALRAASSRKWATADGSLRWGLWRPGVRGARRTWTVRYLRESVARAGALLVVVDGVVSADPCPLRPCFSSRASMMPRTERRSAGDRCSTR